MLHASRHLHGGGGHGRFHHSSFRGGRHGPPGGGGGERYRTRRLSGGDLQLIVLALLEEKARHGYEIIKAVEERSHGYYVPSAGMVYPALTYLTDVGYANVELDGAKKRYSPTDAGRAHLAQNRDRIAAVLDALEKAGQSSRREPAGDTSAAPPGTDSSDALGEAFRDLKAALFDATHASGEERSRVAQILRRAIAEIEGS